VFVVEIGFRLPQGCRKLQLSFKDVKLLIFTVWNFDDNGNISLKPEERLNILMSQLRFLFLNNGQNLKIAIEILL
jgi:hypothetical protein